MDYEQVSFYIGFDFEQPLYLYVWLVLVITTTIANIIIIMILLQKEMRNTTNVALTAIAITDSLTGLVTLPTYIMTYGKFAPARTPTDLLSYRDENKTEEDISSYLYYNYGNETSQYNYSDEIGTIIYNDNSKYQSGFILTPNLCEWFMISKFFISQSFHTMSIWLTVYLGIQRYGYVKYPFLSKIVFTVRNTVIAIICIAILAPVLQIYHVFNRKHNDQGFCEWRLEEGCAAECAYLWISLFLKQLLPCFVLVIVTSIFVVSLVSGNELLRSAVSQKRTQDYRRVSFIVLMIMIFFMIPELPYGLFLFYALISKHTSTKMKLETNRMCHATYEVLLVLSFHSNFWILTFLNKRFRTLLLSTFVARYRRITTFLTTTTTTTTHYSTNQKRRSNTSGSYSAREQKRLSKEPICLPPTPMYESKPFKSKLNSSVTTRTSV